MRRMLVTGLAAFAALAGWATPAGTGHIPAADPTIAMLPAAGPIALAELAPDVLLKAATLVVTANLRQDRNLPANRPAKIAELVESTILPLIDFRHMTRLAVARNWRLASPERQNALVAEFRTLLVRTHSTALADYHEQTIEYQPLRMAPGATQATVRSTVQRPGAERIAIDYEMEKTVEGWRVYEVRIAGVSLVATYRSTFARIVRESGVDGLLDTLVAGNRQTDSGLRSRQSGALPYLFIYAVITSILPGSR